MQCKLDITKIQTSLFSGRHVDWLSHDTLIFKSCWLNNSNISPLHSKSMLGWQEEWDTENQWCFGALSSPHWRASMWHITVCLLLHVEQICCCQTASVWTAERRVILLHLQVRSHFENFMKYDTNNDYTLDFNEVGKCYQFTNLCTCLYTDKNRFGTGV